MKQQRYLIRGTIKAFCLAMMLVLGGTGSMAMAALAQPGPGDVGVNFIKFSCPTVPANPYTDCDIVTGATFRIEADGAEIAGSPFTTGPTGLLPGFFFDAPEGATITVTELGGGPAGFVPAPGFDPLIINAADIPIGGCGGESTCPTIEFINVPDPATSEPTVAPTAESAPAPTAVATEAPPVEPIATEIATPPTVTVSPEAPAPSLELDGRAATIFEGDCGGRFIESFPVFTNLVDLVPAGGEAVGREVEAVPETSFTTVFAPLDDLVAEPHLIAISSAEDEREIVACGDIAALLTESGDLVIALREVDDSGFAGVAYISPGSSEPDQTEVSVFLVEGLAGGGDVSSATMAARD